MRFSALENSLSNGPRPSGLRSQNSSILDSDSRSEICLVVISTKSLHHIIMDREQIVWATVSTLSSHVEQSLDTSISEAR